MIVPVYVPFGVTVKFVDAAFTVPDVGPVRVKEVAEAELAVYERLLGLVSDPEFVGVKVTVPADVGVIVNV